jgi:hypothetical protein
MARVPDTLTPEERKVSVLSSPRPAIQRLREVLQATAG